MADTLLNIFYAFGIVFFLGVIVIIVIVLALVIYATIKAFKDRRE